MRSQNGSFLITTFFFTTFALSTQSVIAQSKTIKPNSPDQPISNQETQNQLMDIENRLQVLKKLPAHRPAVSKESEAFMVIKNSMKGVTSNQVLKGFFLTRLVLVNQSRQPLKLSRDQIHFKVDGQPHSKTGFPEHIPNKIVLVGKNKQSLNALKFEQEVKVLPGKQGSMWLALSDLPDGTHVPEIEIQATVNGKLLNLHVNRFELGNLQHTVSLMGPNQCLAKLTVSGALNSINLASLMNEVDLLTTQKNVRRFVIHFPNQNSFIEQSVFDWLPRAAQQIGMNSIVQSQFPLFPTMISELHLSGVVFKNHRPRYFGFGLRTHTTVTHTTEEAAIHAALDSAMSVLSREKIAEQIHTGSSAVKVAALMSGGRQLTNEELPLVLKLSSDHNQIVQEAALYALRYFGDPRAFERLIQVANSPPGTKFEMAVASLAESRFAEGQQRLLQLLKQQPPAAQKTIIGIIAQSPRPQWGNAIYEFLSSENLELRKAAINALVLNGHPQLYEVLTDALNSSQSELRKVAFQELIKRNDSKSETLAMNYVLSQLEHTVPSQQMLTFINRLKDPRTIPLLARHLKDLKLDPGTRTAILKSLTAIGDQSVDVEFLKIYPQASAAEKLLILTSLQRLGSPHYFNLAQKAIQDSNLSIANGAASSLAASASGKSLAILKHALQKANESSRWNSIYSALVSLGTPEARQTIMQARYDGKIDEKKNDAHKALTRIYQRSPGNHYYQKGLQAQTRKNLKAAIEEYHTAISIDELLIPVYIGLVDVNNSLQKFEEALKYAEQGLKIDKMNPRLYVAKGLVFSNQSNPTEALKQFNKAIELSPLDIFPYRVVASHHVRLKQYQEAIAAYDAIIQIKPDDLQPYLFKAQILSEIRNWDEALKVYDQIIRKNDRYVSAYTGRGHTNLQKTDWKAAQQDFQKAYELNKKSSQAITGLAICMVYNHEEDKAIPFVEGFLKQFENDGLFSYNVACVFGRALINLKDQTKTPDVESKMKAYREKAIFHLTNASKTGFDDVEWMQKDPDLNELHALPSFKSLVQSLDKKREISNLKSTPDAKK
ncbi:HEAT repeat domain-containing protein [Gimesia aquarii]|uniref:Tetratricopeptide repeat protein n=1 Tax=Gimesia aquarii TaxID=2527964 RepID=A0A517X3B9_9PLAN|nr:HEAT repeat domain-containing protein [Gimesia aquarii]QDU11979.1 Tetratricopeptide repeat protein [Gimesia aquarii]